MTFFIFKRASLFHSPLFLCICLKVFFFFFFFFLYQVLEIHAALRKVKFNDAAFILKALYNHGFTPKQVSCGMFAKLIFFRIYKM